MKKLLALLLALAMMLSFAACGGKTEDPADKTTEAAAETTTETPVQKVTIGDYTVEYDGAVIYDPFQNDINKPSLVVYFKYTSNGPEAFLPYTRVFTPAKQNGETISEIQYTNEKCPPEYTNYWKNLCEPGQTIRCANIYTPTDLTGTVEVTFMDNLHTIEEKMVVSIDLSTLETVNTPLGAVEG